MLHSIKHIYEAKVLRSCFVNRNESHINNASNKEVNKFDEKNCAKQNEIFMISKSNTIANPFAMMIQAS